MNKNEFSDDKLLLKIGSEDVELDLNKMVGMGSLLRELEIDFDDLIKLNN